MDNYNKVKTEGIHSEEFEEIIWDLDADDKGKARTFLSTFADKVKEVVERDVLEEVQKSEMTPQTSGYIGVKEAKEWFYKLLKP